MKNPYLIQRANFKNKEGKGIDTLLQFDYMGSSEFEWGALPASLKRVRQNEKEYTQFQFVFEGFPERPIIVLCKDKPEVIEALKKIADNHFRLKEYCDLGDYLKQNERYKLSDFWWDIENDYFFWRSEEKFNVQFKECLFKKIN